MHASRTRRCMNLEDDRERSRTTASLGSVVSRAVLAARRMRCSGSYGGTCGEARPPHELGRDPNFEPTLHTLLIYKN